MTLFFGPNLVGKVAQAFQEHVATSGKSGTHRTSPEAMKESLLPLSVKVAENCPAPNPVGFELDCLWGAPTLPA